MKIRPDSKKFESWLQAMDLPAIMDFEPLPGLTANVLFIRPLLPSEIARIAAANLLVIGKILPGAYALAFHPLLDDEDTHENPPL